MLSTITSSFRFIAISAVLLVSVLASAPMSHAETLDPHADAGWAVFTHTVDDRNSYYAVTWLNDPALNGNPGARIVVCAGPGWGATLADPSALGVFYDHSSARWLIFNQDGQIMRSGMSFNVIVDGPVTTHVTSQSDTEYDWTRLDHPDANGIAHARIFATPVFEGIYHNHPLGIVQTNLGNWAIQNLDSARMPAGLRFNVLVVGSGIGFVHQVSEQGSPTSILSHGPTGNPAARLFVMPVQNGNSTHISPVPVGVRRNGSSYYEIYSLNGAALSAGAMYNVIHWTPISIARAWFTRRHLLVEIDRECEPGMTVLIDGVAYATMPHRRRPGVLKVKNGASATGSVLRVRESSGLLSIPFFLQ